MKKEQIFDVIVIGAGAAGLMTAIMCRRAKLSVLLLDGQKKIGAKILMSGGTRCNVTNLEIKESDYQSEKPRLVRNILSGFTSAEAMTFFEHLGIHLVHEDEGRVYPSTHSGKTVLDAFLRELNRLGIFLENECKVTSVRLEKGDFAVSGNGFQFFARKVVVATGGLSYPSTGSDGVGYRIAQDFKHNIIPTSPALTPLLTDDAGWKKLSGVSLPCRLALLVNGKKSAAFEGSFLFTHFGFSGPAALNISRHWDRLGAKTDREITISFLPDIPEDDFRQNINRYAVENPRRQLKSFLEERLPQRFVETFLKKIKIPESQTMNQLSRKEREEMISWLYAYRLPVTGIMGYGKAEVTAGGVDLSEVDPVSLESKLCPGLFFVGEVLDADGRIGGFNFQWAWASAVAAAKGIINTLKN